MAAGANPNAPVASTRKSAPRCHLCAGRDVSARLLTRQLRASGMTPAATVRRDLSLTDAYLTSRRERKKVEMLFAHLKRILRLDRLRLRGPNGAKDEFLLAATAQNLRKMAKLIPMPAPAMAG